MTCISPSPIGEAAAGPAVGLPPRLLVLFITGRRRSGRWLADALAADKGCEIELDEVQGSAAGLAQLGERAYDAVLVAHEPGALDALDLVEGYRTGGSVEAILVLGEQSEQEMAALCYEVGADGYLCVPTATTRTLLWMLARAVRFRRLLQENQRLSRLETERLQREHDEADQLLRQQRAILCNLEELRRPSAAARAKDPAVVAPFSLPEELVSHYRDLLRAYVIMGSGTLTDELNQLAALLADAGLSAGQAMYLHLRAVDDLIRGLGTRSTRHVMTRADLLVLELVVHLAEEYRRRYWRRLHPPRQLTLPGFDLAGG